MNKTKIANYQPGYPDKFKTKNQWAELGFKGREGAGTKCWTNRHCQQIALYYTDDEVIPMTEEDIREYQTIKKEKAKKYYEKRKVILSKRRKKKKAYLLMKKALEKESIPCNNPSKTIILDTETTGLGDEDEIIQISIIDGDGNVLINELIQPYWTKSWEAAEKIHSISPQMVKDAKFAHEVIPIVKGIFESAELLVGYNIFFDLNMLVTWGIKRKKNHGIYDVMLAFAPIYGEWNEKHKSYTWQKLTKCAAYYGYEFKAHDGLEDVKATLFCYDKIKKGCSV